MKTIFRSLVTATLIGLLMGGPWKAAFAANADIQAYSGSGALNNIDVFRITSTGDIKITDTSSYTALSIDSTSGGLDVYNGSLTLGAIGTTPSLSNYFSIKVPCYNVGAAVTVGTVMVASNTGTGYCSQSPATLDLTNVIGIAAGSIASGAVGNIVISGYGIIKTTGTVSIGDALVSTGTSAGYAGADTTPTTGAKIGVAMKAGSSNDTVLAIITLN